MSERHPSVVQSSKMSGRYPMTETDEQLDEAVRPLRKELRVLREVGLWPAIEKGRLRLLAELARQAAAKSDPLVARRITSGSPAARRQATAEAIKAFITDTVADPLTGLPEEANAALPELFALAAPSADATPDNKERLRRAVAKANFQPSYFDKLASEWLALLSKRMHKRSREDAADNPEQQGASPAPVPATYNSSSEDEPDSKPDAHAGGDGSASTAPEPANMVPPARADREPESLDPAVLEVDQDTQPDADTASPSGEPGSDAPTLPMSDPPSNETLRKPPHWTKQRRRRMALGLCSIGAIAALLAVLATTRGGNGGLSTCGPTTAQLYTLNNPTTLYMYGPHQEGAEHGWAQQFAYFREEPKHKEVFHPGEVRLVALAYVNEETRLPVFAKIALSGASIVPNSTCLYRAGVYSKGTRYAGNPLLAPKGLKISNLASSARVYITFRERLSLSKDTEAATFASVGPENVSDEDTHVQSRVQLIVE
jgi:hypothetical protein